MADVTVTGGADASNITLTFPDGSRSFDLSTQFAAIISNGYAEVVANSGNGLRTFINYSVDDGHHELLGTAPNVNAVVVENPGGVPETIAGASGEVVDGTQQQTVVASASNLTYDLVSGGADIVVAGNDNEISLAGMTAPVFLTLDGLSNTVVAGTGMLTLNTDSSPVTVLGGTNSQIVIFDSVSAKPVQFDPITIDNQGNAIEFTDLASLADVTILGSGASDIHLLGGENYLNLRGSSGNATVASAGGFTSITGGSGALTFYNGDTEADVVGGTGPITAYLGEGGGSVTGGSSGHNSIYGGVSDGIFRYHDYETRLVATITGGGDGDYLLVQSGYSKLIAAGGSETLTSTANNVTVQGGTGSDAINISGANDLVSLGTGAATVKLAGAGSVYLTGNSGQLVFYGDTNASTVVGGTGSMLVYAGAGGGRFTGGSSGNNTIIGGGGSNLITGGGAFDYLEGGSGNSTLVAGAGSEILAFGTGSATLVGAIYNVDAFNLLQAQANQSLEIDNFSSRDLLYVANAATADFVLNNQAISGNSLVIKLDNQGTNIKLAGTTALLTISNIEHG